MAAAAILDNFEWPYLRNGSYDLPIYSDVVLETKVLVSRRLENKNTSLSLGLEIKVLVLILVLTKKVLSIFKPFSSLMTKNHDIVV